MEREKNYHGINVMLYIDLAGAKSLAPVINLQFKSNYKLVSTNQLTGEMHMTFKGGAV